MLKQTLLLVAMLILCQCSQRTSMGCIDITQSKHKNERVDRRLVKNKLMNSRRAIEKQLENMMQEIPLDNMIASTDNKSLALPIESLLKQYSALLPVRPDSIPDDNQKAEVEKLQQQLNDLKTQYETQGQSIEANATNEPLPFSSQRIDPRHEKAKKFGLASFLSLALGASLTVLLPGLAFMLALFSVISAIVSLNHYRKTTNKRFIWMPITSLAISLTAVILLMIAFLLLLALFGQF